MRKFLKKATSRSSFAHSNPGTWYSTKQVDSLSSAVRPRDAATLVAKQKCYSDRVLLTLS